MTAIINGPSVFYTVLTQLKNDLVPQFAGNAFQRVAIVPGAIAWDECDSCGLLALSVMRIFLSDMFPSEAVDRLDESAPYLCADMVVQAIRCVPGMSDTGAPPSVSALEVSAETIDTDALIIMCQTLNTLNTAMMMGSVLLASIRQQVFMGPEGQCGGSELTFTVGVSR